jgi:hypothetical protein
MEKRTSLSPNGLKKNSIDLNSIFDLRQELHGLHSPNYFNGG